MTFLEDIDLIQPGRYFSAFIVDPFAFAKFAIHKCGKDKMQLFSSHLLCFRACYKPVPLYV